MATDTYLLNLRGVDWGHALAPWGRLLPRPLSLLMVNQFGDTFLTTKDESVHVLKLVEGVCEKAADNLREFIELMEIDSMREGLLMTRLADACLEAGLVLRPGQVYGYKIAPFRGGALAAANIRVSEIVPHFHAMAQILYEPRR